MLLDDQEKEIKRFSERENKPSPVSGDFSAKQGRNLN